MRCIRFATQCFTTNGRNDVLDASYGVSAVARSATTTIAIFQISTRSSKVVKDQIHSLQNWGCPVWISLCNLCVLCVSVVDVSSIPTTTETQRPQRLHREEFRLGHSKNRMY